MWTSCWIGERRRPRSPPAGTTSVSNLRIARVGPDADRPARLATGQDHARAAADQLHDRRHATRRGHQPASERDSASLGDRHVRRFAAREPAIPQLPGADARAAPPGPRRSPCWPISAPRNCARPTAWTWRAGRWMPMDSSSISIRCRKPYSRRATATGAASWRRSLAQRGRADRGQGSGVGPLRLGGLCARRGGRGGDRCRRRRRHQLGRGGGPARPRCRRRWRWRSPIGGFRPRPACRRYVGPTVKLIAGGIRGGVDVAKAIRLRGHRRAGGRRAARG
ncbi:hypothetical protein ACVIGA_005858 [Bradyrhizobium sp. USDA 3240]